jgi:hypothetical protein
MNISVSAAKLDPDFDLHFVSNWPRLRFCHSNHPPERMPTNPCALDLSAPLVDAMEIEITGCEAFRTIRLFETA